MLIEKDSSYEKEHRQLHTTRGRKVSTKSQRSRSKSKKEKKNAFTNVRSLPHLFIKTCFYFFIVPVQSPLCNQHQLSDHSPLQHQVQLEWTEFKMKNCFWNSMEPRSFKLKSIILKSTVPSIGSRMPVSSAYKYDRYNSFILVGSL